MKIINKIVTLLTITFLLINQTLALKINEIQFDPTGTDTNREWVEAYNDEANTINFSSYKFFEAGVNHSLTALGGTTLEPGEYGIIVQDQASFLADYPGNTSKLFKSSFSLSNSGETLSIKTSGGTTEDSVSYLPSSVSSGDGFTHSLVSGLWVRGEATPGKENIASIYSGTNTSTTTSTTAATADVFTPSYASKTTWPTDEKIYLSAGDNRIIPKNIPHQFNSKVLNGDKTEITASEYFWSFGDGNTSKLKNPTHTYTQEGEYTVILEVLANNFIQETKMYVKVITPQISLSPSQTVDEDFIQINNNGIEEVKLQSMILRSGTSEFVLPKNFSILPKKSVRVASTTSLLSSKLKEIDLLLPDRSLYFKYQIPITISTTTSSSSINVFVYTPEQYRLLQSSTSSTSSAPVIISKKPVRSYTKNYSVKISSPILTLENKSPIAVEIKTPTSSKIILEKQTGFLQSLFKYIGI